MAPAEDTSASLAPAPVFVDDTGRRRALTRRVGRILVIGFTAYLGLLVVGFARDPRIGPIHLPTFGLPTLGLLAPPAPSALGEQTSRTDTAADLDIATAGAPARPPLAPGRSGSSPMAPEGGGGTGAGPIPALLPTTSGDASGPAPSPAADTDGGATPTTSAPTTTTTTTRNPGNGTKPSTTTTSTTAPATTTSPTTVPTTAPTPDPERGSGRDSEQDTGPAAAKGPDGTGAPGQQRKTTTTTAG